MELISKTTVKKLAPKKGFLAPYIQFPWGYDKNLIGRDVTVYSVDGGFYLAVENKEFKPFDSSQTGEEFKPLRLETEANSYSYCQKEYAAMGIRTPVASVRGSHDWPDYTIAAHVLNNIVHIFT